MEENINPKINQLEERLEDIMNNRLSGSLEYMEGLSEKNIIVFRCAIGNGQNQQKCHPIIAAFVGQWRRTLARERLSDLLAQSLPSDFYQLEAPLQNGSFASALLRLPEPTAPLLLMPNYLWTIF